MLAPAPHPPRASIWEWTLTALLGANLTWTTLCLGGYRPETMMVTSALTGAAVVSHLLSPTGATSPLAATRPSAWWLVPFLVGAAANVLTVSPVPWLGWFDWLGWAHLLAVFWVVSTGLRSPGPRWVLLGILISLGVVAVVLGCYQQFVRPDWLMLGRTQADQFIGRASGPFGIPNSLAAFLLLLLPSAGALAVRPRASAAERVWWGWVTLVFAFGLLLTFSRGAWFGLAIALVAWPLLVTRGPWTRRLRVAVAVGAACLTAGLLLYGASPRARTRLDRLVQDAGELSRPVLWHAAWQLFRERPITGTGAGSYNVLFEQYRPERFVGEPQWAHNDYLNTLSDHGLIGFTLLFGVGSAVAVHRARSVPRRVRSRWDGRKPPSRSLPTAALGIGLLAFAAHLLVDFHLKIPALAMAFAATAGLALRPSQGPPATSVRTASSLKRGAAALAAVAVVFASAWSHRVYRAEALRYAARQAIDKLAAQRPPDAPGLLKRAEFDLRRAVALHAANASAWSDLAFAHEMAALLAPGRSLEAAVPAEEAARRALAISTAVPEFWIRLGVALDMQSRFTEAESAFRRSLALAPRNSHSWYYYAYHLSLDPQQGAAARRALATCLSLDPGNRAAEALREKLDVRS